MTTPTPQTPTTTYPLLIPADPIRPSLANLPLEITLQILETLFRPPQLITIDICGPPPLEGSGTDLDGTTASQTKILVRPPPLLELTFVCRLFRHVYNKIRPTSWGGHLPNNHGPAYKVDLANDIFYIRLHRRVHFSEWNRRGDSHLDPLYNVFGGVENMAIGAWCAAFRDNPWCMCYLRHLSPFCGRFMVLFPGRGLEGDSSNSGGDGDGLELVPVLVPLEEGDCVPIAAGWSPREKTWEYYKRKVLLMVRRAWPRFSMEATETGREAWARTWRLAPVQEVKGYLVDERRLRDEKAWDLDGYCSE